LATSLIFFFFFMWGFITIFLWGGISTMPNPQPGGPVDYI
jgi:hypothetical protein